MGLSFTIGFIQRLLNRERELDFSPEYRIVWTTRLTSRAGSPAVCVIA